jgi:hypothetical protein
MNKIKLILIVGLFIYIPGQAMAWGMLGHRVVGQIAESYLTPKTRVALQKILGYESVAMASTWADFIKSDQSYGYLSPWHYVDFKGGISYSEMQSYLKTDTIADAYTKLNFIIAQLKNKQLPRDKQQMYVRLLIHIIGDIHQPMHTGHVEDQGGNKIMVLWGGEINPTNLHSVWDSRLIESQQLSYTEYAAYLNHTSAAQRAAWQKGDLSQWIFESYTVGQKLYAEITQPNQKLGYRYTFDHLHIAEEQMLKGGVRLAGLLNQIFGA